MSDITLDDIRTMMKGRYNYPLLSVANDKDSDYKTWATLVKKDYPESGENLYETSIGLKRIRDTLSIMEPNDFLKIVNTIRKYEVKGSVRPVSGRKTYGYDKSRLDRSMYKRKRSN